MIIKSFKALEYCSVHLHGISMYKERTKDFNHLVFFITLYNTSVKDLHRNTGKHQ